MDFINRFEILGNICHNHEILECLGIYLKLFSLELINQSKFIKILSVSTALYFQY